MSFATVKTSPWTKGKPKGKSWPLWLWRPAFWEELCDEASNRIRPLPPGDISEECLAMIAEMNELIGNS